MNYLIKILHLGTGFVNDAIPRYRYTIRQWFEHVGQGVLFVSLLKPFIPSLWILITGAVVVLTWEGFQALYHNGEWTAFQKRDVVHDVITKYLGIVLGVL